VTWIRNAWYVAAWDGEVGRNPLARTILGTPVALYRKLDGTPVALRDACPHRLLPLSMGIKEGDSIRCRYHGLKLGPTGEVEEMPIRTGKIANRLCAEVFPIAERHRFVWIWMGDKELADPALIPNLWPCSSPGWVFDGGYYPVKCDWRLMADNLMDLTHETYVHQGSIGQIELMEAPIETDEAEERVFVRRWMPDVDPPPFWASALKRTDKVDRWQICEFVPPSCIMIDVGVAPVGAGATIEEHDQGVRGFVIDALTPETENSMHYFWGMARNFATDDPGFTVNFKAQQAGVFLEDVEVLEAQQRSLAANRDLAMRNLNIDAGGVLVRRMVDRLIAAEREAA
jgi:phenylpropionate dioxygenase-like ring-hydroxylating dioxygenase large terminal subunit